MAYTKLFNSIITSTIWTEDDKTRIVWITMLALADKNGEVQGSVPGLARMAGVSLEACQASLEKFLSPDKFSRTEDDEGRRIEKIDGGWLLLNHAKYRKMASTAEQVEANARRQREYRERKKRNAGVTDSNGDVTGGDGTVTGDTRKAEAEADSKADSPKSSVPSSDKPKKKRSKKEYPEEFEKFWSIYPRRIAKPAAFKAWEKAYSKLPEFSELEKIIRAQSKNPNWAEGNLSYIPHPATWINNERWEDDLGLDAPTPAPPNWREIHRETYSASGIETPETWAEVKDTHKQTVVRRAAV